MKNTMLLYLFLIQFSSFGQVPRDTIIVKPPFITFKNGMRYPVSKPVVICDTMCYFTNRIDKNVYVEPLSKIEGFSKKNDVRWMTYEKFKKIGTTPVLGYFWAIMTFYPTGFGVFIMSDIIKRQHIKKIYNKSRNVNH
jgi:hypothetical protein